MDWKSKREIYQAIFPITNHDQRREFSNKSFEELHRLTGSKFSSTTSYHPMGDSQMEHLNHSVIYYIISIISEAARKDCKSRRNWRLPVIVYAGFRPFFLRCNSRIAAGPGVQPS